MTIKLQTIRWLVASIKKITQQRKKAIEWFSTLYVFSSILFFFSILRQFSQNGILSRNSNLLSWKPARLFTSKPFSLDSLL